VGGTTLQKVKIVKVRSPRKFRKQRIIGIKREAKRNEQKALPGEYKKKKREKKTTSGGKHCHPNLRASEHNRNYQKKALAHKEEKMNHTKRRH